MKISRKRLVEIIMQECEMMNDTEMGLEQPYSGHQAMDGGEMDNEGEFAKRQLHDMEKYARELSEMLTNTTQLESWVQAKLTKAADYLKTVKHYVEYGMEEGAYDQVMPEMGPIDPEGLGHNDPQPGIYDLDDEEMIKIARK